MCTTNHLDNCPPSLDFSPNLCHTNSMNNETMNVRTNVLPLDLCTVTLTEAKWSTIQTALLTIASQCRIEGKNTDASYYLNAYNTLKVAMGMND